MSELKRILRSWDVVGLAVGVAIGAGIFRVSQSIAELLPYPGLILICWLAGGLISIAGGLLYGELGKRFPKSGGDYTYLQHGFGEGVAFLFAWTKVFIVQPASIAAIATIFAVYLQAFLPIETLNSRLLAAGGIVLLLVVNILGVQRSILLQNITTIIKGGCLLALALAAFFIQPVEPTNFFPLIPERLDLPIVQTVGLVLLFILWTYGGWNEGVFLAGEMKRPKEELPKGLIGGTLVITLIYFIVNAAYHYCLPIESLAASSSPAAQMATLLFVAETTKPMARRALKAMPLAGV